MEKERRLVIIGDSAFAEVAHEYFTVDSPYEVRAFAVERAFLKRAELNGLPVVALEDLPQSFDPAETFFFAAVVYTQLNRLRARLYRQLKAMGYQPAGYVSSRANVSPSARIGEHCFVFEANTLQPYVTLGDNVVLWSGNHIGHHSRIGDDCFLASQVVVSGFCEVGARCFIGVNATLSNNLRLGHDNWVGPGVLITNDTSPDQLFRAAAVEPSKVPATRFHRVRT